MIRIVLASLKAIGGGQFVSRVMMAAGAAALGSTPAVAQDGSEVSGARTPENAQRFLNLATSSHIISMTPQRLISASDWLLRYRPIRISSIGRCTTLFEGDPEIFYARDAAGRLVNSSRDATPAQISALVASSPQLVERWSIKTAPYEIDWSKVSSVGKQRFKNASTNDIADIEGSIQIVSGDLYLVFFAGDVELADRMRFAMLTLKVACDKTGGLGF